MPDQIRRARATVGLPDSARTTSPTQSNRVSPNAIRAERSEQEVAANAFITASGFPYTFGTVGQADRWHTATSILIVICPAKPDGSVPVSVGSTVFRSRLLCIRFTTNHKPLPLISADKNPEPLNTNQCPPSNLPDQIIRARATVGLPDSVSIQVTLHVSQQIINHTAPHPRR